MKKIAAAIAVSMALVVGACETISPDDPSFVIKSQIRVCNSYVGALNFFRNLYLLGKMSDADVSKVNTAVSVLGPFCEGKPASGDALDAAESMLETLIEMQLSKQLNSGAS